MLLVDDEADLVRGLRAVLEGAGFSVATAADGEAALAAFGAVDPAIVVLDLMLPVRDGLEVCRELRRVSDVPILMLTARADDVDKIIGLELGADDYLTKPFNTRELIARVRAILRRSGRTPRGRTLRVDARLALDLDGQRALLDGSPIELTATEFALLAHMARHAGRVFTRPELLEQVWGYDFAGDLRTVDVHIRRLRQKVEADPADPRIIRTRFGIGYFVTPPSHPGTGL